MDRILLSAVIVLLAGPALAFSLHLLLVSVAALRGPRPRPGRVPATRVAVLVPAHDEAYSVERCVQSLVGQDYPADLFRVIVVADNCSDDTAAIASAAGAHVVMERDEPGARGKGQALRWALDRILDGSPRDAAVVIIDADSIADRNLLRVLVDRFEDGASVVQGESVLFGDGSSRAALRVVAFLLTNVVRPLGRSALGLPAAYLAGNAMLLSRDVLVKHPWNAYTSAEDLEYCLVLRAAGLDITFAPGAAVRSRTAPNRAAAAQQQLRWEGGQAHLARSWLPKLLAEAFRSARLRPLGIAFDLAFPPLGTLIAWALAGAAVSAGLAALGVVHWWVVLPWMLAILATALSVPIGMRAGHCPWSAYRALARAPLLVVEKVLSAPAVLRFRGDTWVRTERDSDLSAPGP